MLDNNTPILNQHDGVLEGDKQSKTTKLANKIVFIALFVILVSLGVLFSWVSADETPLEINNSPFPIRTIRDHPTAGGVIIMTVDLCKDTDVKGKTRVSFVSSSREFFQPLNDEALPKGCLKREIPILIPEDIPAGEYKVKFRVTYDLNPVKRNVIQEFESQPVEIDPAQ